MTTKNKGRTITTLETQTIKIWKETLKKLRMIHALTGESMVRILERLIVDDLKQKEKRN